jgi:hypothetical protein
MLIKFTDVSGYPIYINPEYVVAVREEKHFGRPGVGSTDEYRDTLVLTTKGDFNVQDALGDVAGAIDQASKELLALKSAGAPSDDSSRVPDTSVG